MAKSPLLVHCSIGRALPLLGDAWMLLILRELFFGNIRYDTLAARTGAATNILADRLRKLVAAGIVDKQVAPDDARRYDYRLTDKGNDLFPVLMSIMAWGDKWTPGKAGPLLKLRHKPCGKFTKPGTHCSACGELLQAENVQTVVNDSYR